MLNITAVSRKSSPSTASEAMTTVRVNTHRIRDDSSEMQEALVQLSTRTERQAASLGEAGCLEYAVFRSIDAADELLLVERYRDAAAVDAHRQSPHYGALVVERILPLLADRRVELLQASPR